ncbi:putative serine/threonine-protein kinase Nek2 [Monocercomonoides exilis]|uniref:putative serine/threonine-protein kinase Nek2 n=1 Tax=Monocercomonoides exilis TaxID=2049356 RepID=UPI00355A4410|nr:putative serine/threonine-protein kinase Nek2 [Monocercomonoides exilis]|eukprot:MONOS_11143.1-p1 / transcript=MONOS_11143.1 / gene=MONOS_11143 / organism=Monocercomonoides_exilis_PA203 / gene_product=NIMA / transcript_product=NIMA / location=Mono_scaffold00543:38545-42518(-) / protein_length=1202 / sequence_SO=supercontig / SO=protein_coding / is_pseudo=false
MEEIIQPSPFQFDDFEIVKEIGHGSYGEVYRVKHKSEDGVFRALKRMKLDSGCLTKEQQCEIYFSQMLKSPYLVNVERVYVRPDADNKNYLFMLMEYCSHGDLSQEIEKYKKKRMPQDLFLDYFCQILLGLHFLHIKNVVHRDLKACNILLCHGGRVKLGDFGLVTQLAQGESYVRTRNGTKFYASPEVRFKGKFSFKSDIFSLGIVAYEMCSYYRPLDQIIQKETSLNSEPYEIKRIPSCYCDEIYDMICSMIQKEESERPTTDKLISLPIINEHIKRRNFVIPARPNITEEEKSSDRYKQLLFLYKLEHFKRVQLEQAIRDHGFFNRALSTYTRSLSTQTTRSEEQNLYFSVSKEDAEYVALDGKRTTALWNESIFRMITTKLVITKGIWRVKFKVQRKSSERNKLMPFVGASLFLPQLSSSEPFGRDANSVALFQNGDVWYENRKSNAKGIKWSDDGTVEMEIDMNKRRLCFYSNKERHPVYFTNIPSQIVLGVGLFMKGDKVEIARFKRCIFSKFQPEESDEPMTWGGDMCLKTFARPSEEGLIEALSIDESTVLWKKTQPGMAVTQMVIIEGIWRLEVELGWPDAACGSSTADGTTSEDTTKKEQECDCDFDEGEMIGIGIAGIPRIGLTDLNCFGDDINSCSYTSNGGVAVGKSNIISGNEPFETEHNDSTGRIICVIGVEVDMNMRRMCFFNRGIRQPVYFTDLPPAVQLGVKMGKEGSQATIIRFEKLPSSAFGCVSERDCPVVFAMDESLARFDYPRVDGLAVDDDRLHVICGREKRVWLNAKRIIRSGIWHFSVIFSRNAQKPGHLPPIIGIVDSSLCRMPAIPITHRATKFTEIEELGKIPGSLGLRMDGAVVVNNNYVGSVNPFAFDEPVAIEINADEHTAAFYIKKRRQSIYISNIPENVCFAVGLGGFWQSAQLDVLEYFIQETEKSNKLDTKIRWANDPQVASASTSASFFSSFFPHPSSSSSSSSPSSSSSSSSLSSISLQRQMLACTPPSAISFTRQSDSDSHVTSVKFGFSSSETPNYIRVEGNKVSWIENDGATVLTGNAISSGCWRFVIKTHGMLSEGCLWIPVIGICEGDWKQKYSFCLGADDKSIAWYANEGVAHRGKFNQFIGCWKDENEVGLEVDMTSRTLTFSVDGVKEPVVFKEIPRLLRFGVGGGAKGGWVEIVQCEPVTATSISEAEIKNIIVW